MKYEELFMQCREFPSFWVKNVRKKMIKIREPAGVGKIRKYV